MILNYAELINTPRRDTVNPTRITDRDAPHPSNCGQLRAHEIFIFKSVHAREQRWPGN